MVICHVCQNFMATKMIGWFNLKEIKNLQATRISYLNRKSVGIRTAGSPWQNYNYPSDK